MKNLLTKKDMELLKSKFIFSDPKELPLSFYYGGQRFDGIPENFDVKTTVEEKNGVRKTVYLATDEKGLQIRYECTRYLDFPVAEYVAFFTNTSQQEGEVLSEPCAFRRNVEGSNPLLTYGTGDTMDARGFHFVTQPLFYKFILSPTEGNPCAGASPFMKLRFDEFNLRLAVGWPGLWKMSLFHTMNGVEFWPIQKRSYIRMKPGETIRTPSLTIMCFEGDDTKGINLWRRWYFAHIMPKKAGKRLKPMFAAVRTMEGYQEHCGVTEEHQLKSMEEYAQSGLNPDLWWIDAGWYDEVNERGGWTHTGNWYPDPKRFPRGLKPIGEKCKELGWDFLLWFEPERAKRGTKIQREHPEWFLPVDKHQYAGKIFEDCLLNLGDPDCVEWLIDEFSRIIQENHVTVYRQDFNLDLLPMWMKNETEERYGAVENAHVQGYLRFWDGLLEKNPGLLIDSCAGGGRRNDMETVKRGVPLHWTDVGYGYHPLRQKQLRMMHEWIPYFRSGTVDWRDENGIYRPADVRGPRNPDLFVLHNSLAPMLCFRPLWDREGVDKLMAYMPVWRKAADLLIGSDYYPLTECNSSPEEFYAAQFDDPKRQTGFIQVINNSCNPEDTCVFYPHFEGGATYTFETLLGDASFEIAEDGGFTVNMKKGNGQIWFYSYTTGGDA